MPGLMLNAFLDAMGAIFSIIPKLLYYIVSCVLSLIDLCQVAFRKLAGLDPIMIPTSEEPITGDSVYHIIVDALFNDAYPAVKTIFWALIILGLFMLFVTSVIAVIRLEYAPDKDKGNSKAGVIKNFFKALFSFAIIPITCLFGMYVANSLVQVIDTATAYNTVPSTEISTYFDKWTGSNSKADIDDGIQQELLNYNDNSYYAYNVFGIRIPTTSQPFSATVFKACAYSCNRVRNDTNYFNDLKTAQTLGIFQNFDAAEPAANVIDEGFAVNAKLKQKDGGYDLDTDISSKYYSDWSGWIQIPGWKTDGLTELSKYNVNAIYYFYNLWSFNYIIAFVALMSIGKSFYAFVLFLMQRMFEILGLFLISPISVGLMPLDNGESLKQWRSAFVTKFALLVIMVLSLNLVTPLVSIGQNIKLFGNTLIDYIITTFFLVASLNAISSLNSMFSKIFTGDDKNWGQIDNAAKGIQGSFAQGVGKAMAAGRIATAPIRLAPGLVRAGARGIGAIRDERINDDAARQQQQRQNLFDAEMATYNQEQTNLNNDLKMYDEYNKTMGSKAKHMDTKAGQADMEAYLLSKGYSSADAKAAVTRLSDRSKAIKKANGGSATGIDLKAAMHTSFNDERNINNQKMQAAQSQFDIDSKAIDTARQNKINNKLSNRIANSKLGVAMNTIGAGIAKFGSSMNNSLKPYGHSLMAISGFDPYKSPKDQDLSMGGLIGGTVYTLRPRNPYDRHRGDRGGGGR